MTSNALTTRQARETVFERVNAFQADMQNLGLECRVEVGGVEERYRPVLLVEVWQPRLGEGQNEEKTP